MAKSTAKVSMRSDLGKRIDGMEIIQLALLPDQWEQFAAYKPSHNELMEGLQRLVDSGYEVSISLNRKKGGVSVSVRGAWEIAKNAGKMFYNNAPSVEGGIALLIFRHFFVCKEGEWVGSELATQDLYS